MEQVTYRDIVKKMTMLFAIHKYYIHNASTEFGLYRGQLPILEQVNDNDNITQKEIAEKLCVSPPSVATSIKRMEKAGFLEKSADENDLRNNRLRLTEKGKQMTDGCRMAFDRIDEQMFGDFTPEECKTLYDFFDRIVNNLLTEEVSPQKVFEFMRQAKHFGQGCRRENEEHD
ncbi:MAG: MarR family winged helix-turn-helix transcriptional regulator [Anaerofustis sp.]